MTSNQNNEKKSESTIASEGVPLYLLDKIGVLPKKEKIHEQPKIIEEKKEVDFIKKAENILKEKPKEKISNTVETIHNITEFVVPPIIEEKEDSLIITNSKGVRLHTSFINIYPNAGSIHMDIFTSLAKQGYNFQLFTFFYNKDQNKIIKDLKRKNKQYKQAIYERTIKDGDTLDLNLIYQELEILRERIKQGNLKILEVGIVLQVFFTEDDVKNFKKESFTQDLNGLDLNLNPLKFQQKEFYDNILSENFKNKIIKNQRIATFQIDNDNASYYNFLGRAGFEPEEGMYVGNDYETSNMVFRNIWKSSNFNFMVVGKSGGGKSYGATTLLTREYSQDTIVYIIDPENEFKTITEELGGEVIDIKKEENKINPFDFNYIHLIDIEDIKKMTRSEAISFFEDVKEEFNNYVGGAEQLIKIILKAESAPNKNNYLLNKAILKYLGTFGVDQDNPLTYFKLKSTIPSILGFFNVVKDMEQNMIESDRIISNYLEKYVFGSKKSMFKEGVSKLSVSNEFTTFSFRGIEDADLDIMVFVVSRFLMSLMINPKLKHRKKRLAIDEAHIFFEDYDMSKWFLQMIKRGRKYKMGVGLITQTVNNFFTKLNGEGIQGKEIGTDIVNNMGFNLIMAHKGEAIENLRKYMSLGDNEIDFVTKISDVYDPGVGLLITENKKQKNITKIRIKAEQFLEDILAKKDIHKDKDL